MSSLHTKKSLLIFGSQFLSLGLRFFSNIVLAWLLVPADFGVAAIVFTIITGASLFSDVGISDAVIRNKDGDDPDFLKTAQILLFFRGVILYLAVFLLAPYAEQFFAIKDLTQYLRIAALNLLVLGFESVRIMQLTRHLKVLPGVAIELIAQLLTAVVVIALAFYYRNVWPLVFSIVISACIAVLLGQLYKPSRLSFKKINRTYAKEILSFGIWILMSTVFSFFIMNADRLVLVKLSDTTNTGLFHLAVMFAGVVFLVSQKLIFSVLFPVVSSSVREGKEGPDIDLEMEQILKGFLPILLVGSLAIFFGARLLFGYLYADGYQGAIKMTQYLVPVFWLMMIYVIGNRVIISKNRPGLAASFSAMCAMTRILACILGYQILGVAGFILGLGVGSMLGILLQQFWMRTYMQLRFNYLISRTLVLFSVLGIYSLIENYFHSHTLMVYMFSIGLVAIFSSIYLWSNYAHKFKTAIQHRNMS